MGIKDSEGRLFILWVYIFNKCEEGGSMKKELGNMGYGIIVLIGIFIGFLLIFISNNNRAEIYNKQYNTDYSAWDFLWSEELIKDYVHKGEQKTFNLKVERE